MVTFMIKYFIIQRMKEEGASHLPAPPAGCFGLDDGPIPTAPPKISMVTNQYMGIFESHLSPHLFQEFICSHSSVPHFTSSYHEIVTSIKSFQLRRPIVEIGSENWFAAGCQFGNEVDFLQAANSATKTGSLQVANSAAKTGSLQAANSSVKTGSLQVANSAAKTGSLQPTQFWQRMLIRRSQHSFGRESQFRC